MLSNSGHQACVTCHQPALAWGDGKRRAVDDDGNVGALRSPTLINVAWLPLLGWDGKFQDIEAVTFAAVSGAGVMHLAADEAVRRLAAAPAYKRAFEAAFADGDVTRQNVEMALATFERTIVSGRAPFDRWIEGDEAAIDKAAQRGFTLFNGRAGCADCHAGWAFTDGSFHDIGTAQGSDLGRGRLYPDQTSARYAFKVPTLREVARRAPYMHDGSIPTLEAVIDLYDRGGIQRPSRASTIRPLGLSERDKSDLVAFLRTLTSPDP